MAQVKMKSVACIMKIDPPNIKSQHFDDPGKNKNGFHYGDPPGSCYRINDQNDIF